MKILSHPILRFRLSFIAGLILLGQAVSTLAVPYKATGTIADVQVVGAIAPSPACPFGGVQLLAADEGNGTHLGRYASLLFFEACPFFGPNGEILINFQGYVVLVAANGDELHSELAFVMEVDLGSDAQPITAGWEITGGTGRFDGAGGTGVIAGALEIDPIRLLNFDFAGSQIAYRSQGTLVKGR